MCLNLCHKVASLVLLALIATASTEGDNEELFIGWKGETYKPKNAPDLTAEQKDGRPHIYNITGKKPWVQVLSWSPRAFVYHNFLSEEEARHIVKLASTQMKRSTVVGANNSGVVDDIRTSAGTFLSRNTDPVITAIEHRLAIWSHLPPSHQEDMQVLRYGPTNKYGPHIDGLERVMSVLIYLIEPEEGGETAFPLSNGWLHPEMATAQGKFSSCAAGHVAYKPKRGDALLFYDVKPDYKQTDQASTHTGCPVIKGVKWNAVKWIHGKPFREDDYQKSLTTPFKPLPDPGMCVDLHERCQQWAESGECEKNSGYMTGSSSGQGMCRKSCKNCKECKKNDRKCIEENRKLGGYINFDPTELESLFPHDGAH